jgi:protein disulfide-isomerase-like protein
MIEMGKQMQKFKPTDSELSQEKVTAFVSGVLDGSIKRHLMSEAEPEKNDEPVFYITGTNFESVAYDENKAVFIEFYAPWCGHCKSLAPAWDKLGEAFADRDDIVIAKSDATANEFDGVEVSGFPTIKYFPKGERKIVDYSGGRDFDSLKKFVENDGAEAPAEAEEEDDTEEDVEEEEEEKPSIVHDDIRRPSQNFVLTLPPIEEITKKHTNSARMRPRSHSMSSADSSTPDSPLRGAMMNRTKSCPAHTQRARVAEKNKYVSVDRGHTFIMPKRFTFNREALLLSYVTPSIYSKAKWPDMRNYRLQDSSSSSSSSTSHRATSTFQVLSTLRSPQYIRME